MTDHANVNVEEIRLTCSDGIEIAGQRWTNSSEISSSISISDSISSVSSISSTSANDGMSRLDARRRINRQQISTRILCVHGFLDNCRSFHLLAPFLVSRMTNVELVALDYPGHGLSSHKSMDSPPTMIINDLCYYVREACQSLQWGGGKDGSFILIGHSLGSIISLIYAATFPEDVQKLILLDGYGPDNYDMFAIYMMQHQQQQQQQQQRNNKQQSPTLLSIRRPKSMVTERIQRHVRQRYNRNALLVQGKRRTDTPKRTYPNIHVAVQARRRTAELSPGSQWISTPAALEMVKRAVVVVAVVGGNEHEHEPHNDDEQQPVQFIHDPRLHLPPLMLNTMEQVDVYWKQVQCPTLWLRADDGWPFPKAMLDRAEQHLTLGHVQYLPGSHHFHADPDSADAVAHAIWRNILTPPTPTTTTSSRSSSTTG
jgi:pimeloyl-ACP methyl ester carboxylesterase